MQVWFQVINWNLFGILIKVKNLYRVYKKETLVVEESIHVRFDDKRPDTEVSELEESFASLAITKEDDDGVGERSSVI